MKKLPGAIVAFYPPVWRGVALVLFGAAFTAFTFLSVNAFAEDLRANLVFFVFAAVWLFYGLREMFWPAPICLLYPEKVRVGKKELFWDQIESCYVREELRYNGRRCQRVPVLIFLPKPDAGAELLKANFCALSGKDRKLLEREIAVRGVYFMPRSDK